MSLCGTKPWPLRFVSFVRCASRRCCCRMVWPLPHGQPCPDLPFSNVLPLRRARARWLSGLSVHQAGSLWVPRTLSHTQASASAITCRRPPIRGVGVPATPASTARLRCSIGWSPTRRSILRSEPFPRWPDQCDLASPSGRTSLCVPADDPRQEHLRDIWHLPEFHRLEIQHFLEIYKDLEPGKSVEGAEWVGRSGTVNLSV